MSVKHLQEEQSRQRKNKKKQNNKRLRGAESPAQRKQVSILNGGTGSDR